MKTENIIIAVLTAAVVVLGYLYFGGEGISLSKALSPQQASEKALAFINESILTDGNKAELVGEVVEERGLYKFTVKVADQEVSSYITKDGTMIFPQEGIDLTKTPETPTAPATQPVSTPKQEVPDVKLFVMSYCPYGLQAEKGFLPVYDLLKGKAEMGIYFVDYVMHGKQEMDENTRQYCIQKEEKEKFGAYLGCFTKDDDSEKCLNEAQVDKTKLESCLQAADSQYEITANYENEESWLNGRFPQYEVNGELAKQYGVQGSPTLVINGVVAEGAGRSPEEMKTAVCQAFTSQPSECSQSLSNLTPSSGFGEGEGSSGGSCE